MHFSILFTGCLNCRAETSCLQNCQKRGVLSLLFYHENGYMPVKSQNLSLVPNEVRHSAKDWYTRCSLYYLYPECVITAIYQYLLPINIESGYGASFNIRFAEFWNWELSMASMAGREKGRQKLDYNSILKGLQEIGLLNIPWCVQWIIKRTCILPVMFQYKAQKGEWMTVL